MTDQARICSDVNPGPPVLPADRAAFAYRWPHPGAFDAPAWRMEGAHRRRTLPESPEELAADSRWPGFFPSPICLVTSAHGGMAVLEKVVGPSIANRFPYLTALSFCREPLSDRHHARGTFLDVAQKSGRVAVQFLMPGPALSKALKAIADVPEARPAERLAAAGAISGTGRFSGAPILDEAYLVYEGRLARPSRDFEGQPINPVPYLDVGSHRILLFEIEAISLNSSIAQGNTPLHWRCLPTWRGAPQPLQSVSSARRRTEILSSRSFVKSYQADYVFPGANTIAFEAEEVSDGFSVKRLAPLPEDQVEIDNDLARWPCFFPSSLGLITATTDDGRSGVFPCGSTAVVSRHPLTIAICVTYASINERYAPRATLELLRQAGRFGCGVPIYRGDVLEAIRFLGSVSFRDCPDKIDHAGLAAVRLGGTLAFEELPVHFDCRIVGEVALGTHAMILGQVEQVFVRRDVGADAPLEWCPWAGATAP